MKNIILKRRKQLGLTQQELADKLFVSNKVISKMGNWKKRSRYINASWIE